MKTPLSIRSLFFFYFCFCLSHITISQHYFKILEEGNAKKDFLLQFDWQQANADCFSWDILDEAENPMMPITLTDLNVSGEEFTIEELPVDFILRQVLR